MEDATAEAEIRADLAGRGRQLHAVIAGTTDQPILDTRIATMGVMDPATGRWQFFCQRTLYASYYHVPQPKTGLFARKIKNPPHEAVQTYLRIGGSAFIRIWPEGSGIMNIPAHGDPDQ